MVAMPRLGREGWLGVRRLAREVEKGTEGGVEEEATPIPGGKGGECWGVWGGGAECYQNRKGET